MKEFIRSFFILLSFVGFSLTKEIEDYSSNNVHITTVKVHSPNTTIEVHSPTHTGVFALNRFSYEWEASGLMMFIQQRDNFNIVMNSTTTELKESYFNGHNALISNDYYRDELGLWITVKKSVMFNHRISDDRIYNLFSGTDLLVKRILRTQKLLNIQISVKDDTRPEEILCKFVYKFSIPSFPTLYPTGHYNLNRFSYEWKAYGRSVSFQQEDLFQAMMDLTTTQLKKSYFNGNNELSSEDNYYDYDYENENGLEVNLLKSVIFNYRLLDNNRIYNLFSGADLLVKRLLRTEKLLNMEIIVKDSSNQETILCKFIYEFSQRSPSSLIRFGINESNGFLYEWQAKGEKIFIPESDKFNELMNFLTYKLKRKFMNSEDDLSISSYFEYPRKFSKCLTKSLIFNDPISNYRISNERIEYLFTDADLIFKQLLKTQGLSKITLFVTDSKNPEKITCKFIYHFTIPGV